MQSYCNSLSSGYSRLKTLEVTIGADLLVGNFHPLLPYRQ